MIRSGWLLTLSSVIANAFTLWICWKNYWSQCGVSIRDGVREFLMKGKCQFGVGVPGFSNIYHII